MPIKTLQRSFVGGEVSSDVFGHIDDVKYQSGAARLRNFVVKGNGCAQSRPGTAFVRESHHSQLGEDKKFRLIPFSFSTTQTMAIEMGAGYFRFHTDGATVLAPDVGTVASYVVNRTFTPANVDIGSDWIGMGAAHGITVGQPVIITSDNAHTLPAPLVNGTTYYAIIQSGTALAFAETEALAIANTRIDLIDIGQASGQFRLNYAYVPGDLVEGTVAGAPGIWYCVKSPVIDGMAAVVPGGDPTYWHEQPDTGEYEIYNPYTEAELPEVTHAGSNDIVTMAHAAHPVYLLQRESATRWTFVVAEFNASLAAPSNLQGNVTYGLTFAISGVSNAAPTTITTPASHGILSGTMIYVSGITYSTPFPTPVDDGYYYAMNASGSGLQLANVDSGTLVPSSGTYNANSGIIRIVSQTSDQANDYKVTAVGSDERESVASANLNLVNNLLVDGAYNVLTWAAVAGATRYRVYRKRNSLYGLLGETEALTFQDDGSLASDLGRTLPIQDETLETEYPACVGYFEQRKLFAASTIHPQHVWMTESGTENGMSYHLPIQDTDRISFDVAALENCTIRHIVPMAQLLLLSSSTEFRVTPVNSDALTPSSVAARSHTFVGCSTTRPVVVNNTVVFGAARGGHIYELGFDSNAESFLANDLALRAGHLFDGFEVTDSAYAKAPHPLLWFISTDGVLLGLTYVPEQQIAAWHRHNTDGTYETCCVVSEGQEDRLYVGVKRTIGGVTKRYVERLAPLTSLTIADSFCVDSGITYEHSGATATISTISGLSHLEGKTVSVLAKGAVQTSRVVASGQISITPVSMADGDLIHVGLPFVPEVLTVPATMAIEAYASGRTKNVNKVWLRVQSSGRFRVGPDENALVPAQEIAANTLYTGPVQVTVPSGWADDGQILVRMLDPLPLTIVSITAELTTGGS